MKNKKLATRLILALSLMTFTTSSSFAQHRNQESNENTFDSLLMCSNDNESSYMNIAKEATKLAIMELLIVSEMPRTYSRSCAEREFGCESHIESIVDLFFEQYKRRGIDPLILAAMAKHETNFNPFAVNGVYGAAGLLQLLPSNRYAKGIRFIHSPSYREQCRTDYYACQGEVVEASVMLLERSISRCNGSLLRGLGMYGSGSCEGSRRFSKYVVRLANKLRARQTYHINQLIDSSRRNVNMCIHNIG